MYIINLTQHTATREQSNMGVVDLSVAHSKTLRALLTFEKIPTEETLLLRAEEIANNTPTWAAEQGVTPSAAMIGGAPYFMPACPRGA